MKLLTVVVDDKTLFSGEIAELQWSETLETVSVTARFTPSQSLLQTLQGFTARNQPPQAAPEPDGSPGRPALDVVRGTQE